MSKAKVEKKASIYDVMGVDEQAQANGAELILGESTFICAYAGATNKTFESLLTAKTKPYRRAIQTNTMSMKLQDKILIEVYAKCIVLGWKDVFGLDGEEIKYSQEACIQIFTDLPILFKEIQEFASNHSVFRKELDDVDAGNSPSS